MFQKLFYTFKQCEIFKHCQSTVITSIAFDRRSIRGIFITSVSLLFSESIWLSSTKESLYTNCFLAVIWMHCMLGICFMKRKKVTSSFARVNFQSMAYLVGNK